MKLVFNVFTGTLDYVNTPNSGTAFIPELTSDPVSPDPQTAWVLKEEIPEVIGSPIGLLLSLTYSTSLLPAYEFSYQTIEGNIVRVPLS